MALTSLEQQSIDRAKSRAFGKEESKKNSASVSSLFKEPELGWRVVISLPFSYAASKNSTYGYTETGKKFVRPEVRAYRDSIAFLLKSAVKEVKIKKHKVWIDIYVEKPNNYGDAVNVVDIVCDAIKLAIPVDDRWYAIRRLDWSINKNDPQLFIGISQEINIEDSKSCSYCGQIKPLSAFTSNNSQVDGKHNKCKSCRLRVPEKVLEKYPNRRTWKGYRRKAGWG